MKSFTMNLLGLKISLTFILVMFSPFLKHQRQLKFLRETEWYNLDILVMSEFKWSDSGCQVNNDSSIILLFEKEDTHFYSIPLVK